MSLNVLGILQDDIFYKTLFYSVIVQTQAFLIFNERLLPLIVWH